MVKKIIEDVVSTKKEPETFFRPVQDKEVGNSVNFNPHDPSLEKKEFHKEMKHIEEIVPSSDTEESNRADEAIDKSPIFTKMKQRHEERESFSQEYATDQENKIRRYLGKGAIVAGILLVIGAVVWSTMFYSASVAIHLKHVKAGLNNQEFLATAEGSESVPFQIMSLSGEDTVKLTPTGEKRVTKKASGEIIIYNNFNAQPQTLVKNTRFQTPDLKTYHIEKQIVVPGMKKVDGKDVPGSIAVLVYAAEAGPEYNIGLVDFTIPGFKGSPRYQKFYGRSKTSMTGGASGMVKTISDADVEKAKIDLTKTLTEKLLADAKIQKPKGTVLYTNAAFFTFTDTLNDSVQSGEKDVPFTLKGTLEAVLFGQPELSRQIVKTTGEVTANEKINIDNIESLAFAWKTPRGSVPEKTEKLDFFLSGSANAVWEVDVKALKNKLAGRKESDYNSVSVQFPGIEKTSKKDINPFWRNTFPKNTEKISVETVID